MSTTDEYESYFDRRARLRREKDAMRVRTLRFLADLIEAQADLVEEEQVEADYVEAGMNTWHITDRDEARRFVRMALAHGAKIAKGYWSPESGGGLQKLTVTFPGCLPLDALVSGALCERVKVGEKSITIPAQVAREAVPERTEVVPVYVTKCEPLLASDDIPPESDVTPASDDAEPAPF